VQEFWNDRYSDTIYAYGTAPNAFFKQSILRYQPSGKMLLPAEGEGRNAVFAAQKGLEVTAFDWSEAGQRKALQLAQKQQVEIEYLVGALNELTFEHASFDALGLIFAHFPAYLKACYHRYLARLLKPGGLVIFEAFGKNHLTYRRNNPNAGGPKDIAMLASPEELLEDFPHFEILELEEKEVELNEGIYHQGLGSVVRFVARKT